RVRPPARTLAVASTGSQAARHGCVEDDRGIPLILREGGRLVMPCASVSHDGSGTEMFVADVRRRIPSSESNEGPCPAGPVAAHQVGGGLETDHSLVQGV